MTKNGKICGSGCSDKVIQSLARCLHCRVGKLLVMHLRLPTGGKPRLRAIWSQMECPQNANEQTPMKQWRAQPINHNLQRSFYTPKTSRVSLFPDSPKNHGEGSPLHDLPCDISL